LTGVKGEIHVGDHSILKQ